MKKYLIFAGVNGAGKTTLYQTNSAYKDLPRVNMDEIVGKFKKIIPMCDRVKIYDNTKSFRKIASFIQGECKDCVDEIPEWCNEIFEKVSV